MKWIGPVLALVIGFVLGAVFFGASPEEPSGEAVSGRESERASGSSPAEPAVANGSAPQGESEEAAVVSENGAISESWLDSLEDLDDFDRIGALHARLRNVPTSEFESVMNQLGEIDGSPTSWQSRSMIAARWAELDPKGLKTYIESQPRNQRWGLRSALYSTWAKKDLAGALASARQLSGSERSNAIGSIAASLVETAPDRALALLQEQSGGHHRQRWSYQNLFRNWARKDPDGALAAAYQIEDKQSRSAALVGVISDLAKDDPQAAIEWLDGQESGQMISQTKGNLLNQFLQEDVDAVLNYVGSREDPLEVRKILRNLHFSQLGAQADFDKINSVMDWLGTVATGQTYSNKVGDIVKAMVQVDPGRARRYVSEMAPGAARLQAINAVANSLVREDVDAAINFFNSLEFKDEKQRAMSGISWQLVQNDPERAKEFMLTSEDPMVQRSLSNQLARALSGEDRDTSLEWAAQIEDQSARDNALRNIVSEWVVADPQAAFDYIAGLEEAGNGSSLYQNALNSFVRDNPAEGVLWLERLADDGAFGERADHTYQQAANAYLRHDPMAASEWIATLDPGENRDGAVSSLVQHIHEDDPEAGFRWAATVDDENRRRRSLDQSVKAWAKANPGAAREAIRSADIEAPEKERLFGMLPGD